MKILLMVIILSSCASQYAVMKNKYGGDSKQCEKIGHTSPYIPINKNVYDSWEECSKSAIYKNYIRKKQFKYLITKEHVFGVRCTPRSISDNKRYTIISQEGFKTRHLWGLLV